MRSLITFLSLWALVYHAWALSPDDMVKVKGDGKIIGGKNSTIEDHPYQLSFQVFKTHYCGATLYKPDIAITAAHCTEEIHEFLNDLTVRAGSSSIQEGGQVARVLSICDHPKFNGSSTKDYDVSVLKLDHPLVLGAKVQVLPLQPVKLQVPAGKLGRVSGWGSLDEPGNSFPVVLQALDVPKVDHKTCEDYYKPRTITSRMICFGYEEGEKDACAGDSGGPLVVDGRLVGVISWGFGCARPRLPGVYAKISNPEISGHIEKCMRKFK